MTKNVKVADIEKATKLSAAISSLPESEREKLSYVVEGIKLADCIKSA